MPLPISTLITDPPQHATAASAFPSRSKSAIVASWAPAQAGYSDAVPKVPSPLPSKTLIVALPWSAVTRSRFPSPSTSAAVTDFGCRPTRKLADAAGVAVPSPSSTVTVSLPALATARSACPSPSRSSMTTPCALSPVGTSCAGPNGVVSPGSGSGSGSGVVPQVILASAQLAWSEVMWSPPLVTTRRSWVMPVMSMSMGVVRRRRSCGVTGGPWWWCRSRPGTRLSRRCRPCRRRRPGRGSGSLRGWCR